MSTTTENQHLRSKYTDQQLRDALITATEVTGKIFVRGRTNDDGAFSGTPREQSIVDFHALLNVLDTLNQDDNTGTDVGEDTQHAVLQAASDEWQPASLDDVEMTDEAILALYADGTGVQGTPDGIGEDDLYLLVNGQQVHVARNAFDEGRAWLYRIPGPLPNPELHWFIRCNRTKTILQATPEGKYLDNLGTAWPPSNFKDWTPMNVVEAAGTESDG